MKALLIAEKPSLMRDIRKVYNTMSFKDDITFMALAGHVLELQAPEEYDEKWGQPWTTTVLPMIPEKFIYKPSSRTKSLYNEAKNAILTGGYDYIINACDAGREGELIFYSLYKTVGKKVPVKRYWATNTTDTAVENALNNLLDDKDPILTNLKASAQYRAYFDWLMGMNYTRAITLGSGVMIPVGRVMTPTLAIVVNRELEILDFKPEDYYEIEAQFDDKYSGTWFDPETKETKVSSKEKADKIIESAGEKGTIEAIETKRSMRKAPTLHSLTELQKDCNRMFGYTATKTLELAQKLYEEKKLLTYPRTESRYLPRDMVKDIPKHVNCLKNISEISTHVNTILSDKVKMNKVLASKDYVNDSKVTDHHAIIPTMVEPLMSSLTKDEKNVYLLVAKRFIAIFMDPFVTDNTVIITDANGEKFKTAGKIVIDKGYTVLFKAEVKDVILPLVKKGESFKIVEKNLLEKQTTPPNRYNEASLLTAMQSAGKEMTDAQLRKIMKETAGLGTVATRASIIEKLISREYIKRTGKNIVPTDDGIKVIKALDGKDIISPMLTAEWENKLSKIEDGELKPNVFYDEMIAYIKSETEGYKTVKANIPGNSSGAGKVIGKCPSCGGEVVSGKKVYYCKNYKKDDDDSCKFVFGKTIANAKISEAEAIKLISGKETKKLKFKTSNGEFENNLILLDNKVQFKPFDKSGSTGTDSGKDAMKSEAKELKDDETKENLGICPKCGSKVVEGKDFYLCTEYGDKCDFNFKKNIKKGSITVKDIKDILSGKKTEPIKFVWGSGKSGNARLSYDKKLNWHFDK